MSRFWTWTIRGLAMCCLLCSLGAGWLAPAPFDQQFRESVMEPPSRRFPLGTDELGRDRLSRLLHGSRVSFGLAVCAALASTLIAASLGTAAALRGGAVERLFLSFAELTVSAPSLFLILVARSLLPLETTPMVSVMTTFALLGLLGWAGPARVVWAGAKKIRHSGFVLQARANGSTASRLLWRQLAPNLAPLLRAQFWIALPAFIVAEANLGLLGLGVAEPLPSLGSLLREMDGIGRITEQPATLAPAIWIAFSLWSCQMASGRKDPSYV
ncbi:MAG: ABC transporter permease [Bryobacteraceae bacterium]